MSTLVLVEPEGRIICERCELAGGLVSRMRGLSGRTPLSRRRGMLMRPTWIVRTAFMHFPVDVILLDRELTVLAVREHVQPWRTAGHLRAHSVLKLAAGNQQRSPSGSATDFLGDPCPVIRAPLRSL